jgi:hypothetical protein
VGDYRFGVEEVKLNLDESTLFNEININVAPRMTIPRKFGIAQSVFARFVADI